MDFLEKLFAQSRRAEPATARRTRLALPAAASGRRPTAIPYAHASEHESGSPTYPAANHMTDRAFRACSAPWRSTRRSSGWPRSCCLWWRLGGVLGLVLLLPLVGKLVAGVGAPDLSALLTDLPRLVSMLLVDVPKAVLDYLAPLLQLKTALEGKA